MIKNPCLKKFVLLLLAVTGLIISSCTNHTNSTTDDHTNPLPPPTPPGPVKKITYFKFENLSAEEQSCFNWVRGKNLSPIYYINNSGVAITRTQQNAGCRGNDQFSIWDKDGKRLSIGGFDSVQQISDNNIAVGLVKDKNLYYTAYSTIDKISAPKIIKTRSSTAWYNTSISANGRYIIDNANETTPFLISEIADTAVTDFPIKVEATSFISPNGLIADNGTLAVSADSKSYICNISLCQVLSTDLSYTLSSVSSAGNYIYNYSTTLNHMVSINSNDFNSPTNIPEFDKIYRRGDTYPGKAFNNGAFSVYISSEENFGIFYLYIPEKDGVPARIVSSKELIEALKIPNIDANDYSITTISNDGMSFALVNTKSASDDATPSPDTVLNIIVTNNEIPIWSLV
jgi:hypothetical protein